MSQKRLQSWVTAHHPDHFTGPHGIYSDAATNDAAAAVAAATGGPDGTFANMQILGSGVPEAEEAHVAYYNAETAAPGSDDAVTKLYNAPCTAMTRVSDMARVASGWNPVLLGGDKANALKYQDYLTRVVNMPLFTLQMATTTELLEEAGYWPGDMQRIARLFTGISAEDESAIVSGLTNIANAASTTMDTTEKQSLFILNAMNVANDVYRLYLYHCVFSFYEKKGKGFDTKLTHFSIVQVILEWQMSLWKPETARLLVGPTAPTLEDWAADSGVPQQPNTIPALAG